MRDRDLTAEDEDAIADWRECRDAGDVDGAEAVLARLPRLAPIVRRRLSSVPLVGAAFAREAAPATPAPLPSIPAVLGDFRLVAEIGRGGMGVVYEAVQVSLKRRVALKVLYPSVTCDGHAVERFQREARAAARLHHTHLVPVYALGRADGFWYLAMELIDGPSLAHLIKAQRATNNGRRAPPDLLRLASSFASVAEGLELAHQHGILHRDVKPSNLLVGPDGTLRLADFGLARMERDSHPDLTASGAMLGTPAYLPPEQLRHGTARLDARADVYGLGASLYEAITQRPLYPGRDARQVLAALLVGRPARLRTLEPRVPRSLEAVVEKATAQDPGARYAAAGDFAEDLRRFAAGLPTTARPLGPLRRAWRQVRRHPVRAAVGALLLLAAAAVFVSVGARRAADEREASTRLERERLEHDRAMHDAADAVSRGRPDQARAAYSRALAVRPNNVDALVLRALASPDSRDEALEDVERARRAGLAPDDVRLLAADVGVHAAHPAGLLPPPADLPALGHEPSALRLLCVGRICMFTGPVEEALRTLDRLVNSRPESEEYVVYARQAVALAHLLPCLPRWLRRGDAPVERNGRTSSLPGSCHRRPSCPRRTGTGCARPGSTWASRHGPTAPQSPALASTPRP